MAYVGFLFRCYSTSLYGCFRSAGSAYGFDILAEEDRLVAAFLESNRLGSPTWFFGQLADRVFFGQRNFVGKVLGWKHAIARDSSSRPLEFMLVYVTQSSVKLPSWREVRQLDGIMLKDLEALASNAMRAGGAPLNFGIPALLPQFEGPRNGSISDSDWDGVVVQQRSRELIFAGDDGGRGYAVVGGREDRQYGEVQLVNVNDESDIARLEREKLGGRGGGRGCFFLSGSALCVIGISLAGKWFMPS